MLFTCVSRFFVSTAVSTSEVQVVPWFDCSTVDKLSTTQAIQLFFQSPSCLKADHLSPRRIFISRMSVVTFYYCRGVFSRESKGIGTSVLQLAEGGGAFGAPTCQATLMFIKCTNVQLPTSALL